MNIKLAELQTRKISNPEIVILSPLTQCWGLKKDISDIVLGVCLGVGMLLETNIILITVLTFINF